MSADSLNYCANSGLISELIGELTGDDVLVRYVGSESASEISPIVKTVMFSLKITLFKHICVCFSRTPFQENTYLPFIKQP